MTKYLPIFTHLSPMAATVLLIVAGCVNPQDHGAGVEEDAGVASPGDAGGSVPVDSGTVVADGGETPTTDGGVSPRTDGGELDAGPDIGPPIDPAVLRLSVIRWRTERTGPFDESRSTIHIGLHALERDAVTRPTGQATAAESGPCRAWTWTGVGTLAEPEETITPARIIALAPEMLEVRHNGRVGTVEEIDGSLNYREAAIADTDRIAVDIHLPGHPTISRTYSLRDAAPLTGPSADEGFHLFARNAPVAVTHGPGGLAGGHWWLAISSTGSYAVCEEPGWDGDVTLPWSFMAELLRGDVGRGGLGQLSLLMRSIETTESSEDGIPFEEIVEELRQAGLRAE